MKKLLFLIVTLSLVLFSSCKKEETLNVPTGSDSNLKDTPPLPSKDIIWHPHGMTKDTTNKINPKPTK